LCTQCKFFIPSCATFYEFCNPSNYHKSKWKRTMITLGSSSEHRFWPQFLYIPISIAKIKQNGNAKCLPGHGATRTLTQCWCYTKWHSVPVKIFGKVLLQLNMPIYYNPDLPMRNESVCLQKCLFENACNSFIHKNQKLEIIQISINRK
jgi:hypothetical protein